MANKSFKKNAAELFISSAEEVTTPEETQEDLQSGKARIGYTIGLVPEKKTERMQLLVKPSVKAAIKQLADERGLSMNDLIGQIFEDYLERQV